MASQLNVLNPNDVGIPRVIPDAEMEVVRDILQEFSQYQWWRAVHGGHWEETAEILLPTARNTFFYQNYNTPGMKRTQQQIDGTGGLALHRFCAIADSLITPRNQYWHGLTADGPDADYIMKDRATRLWFEDVTRRLFALRYAPSANFAGQNYNQWQSLGAFGNATMFIDALDSRWDGGEVGLRYRAVPLGETFYGTNHQGRVDRMIRWFRLTAWKAVQKFGMKALPANLRAPLMQNSQWPYNFLHCVKPRRDWDPQAIGAKRFPYCSYYMSIEGYCLMAPEGGYRKFPFAVSRYDVVPGESYGRGPAQIVLPALKTLNAEKATFLKQGHRAADPVLLLGDDGIIDFDLRPGAQNKGALTADGKRLVDILPTGNIDINEKMMAEERALIDDTFLVSLFKVLSEHPNMTATQVIELVNEKAMLVAPTLGRQHDEYVAPMVERELDVCADLGLLPPMPPRLREAGGRYRVVDTSPLALAARANEAAGFVRTVETVRELVNVTQDVSLLDSFNFDVAVPEIASIQKVPELWMATSDQVAQKRQARAQAQQREQQIQAAPAQAAMIKARAVAAKSGYEIGPSGQPVQPGGA